MNKANKVFMFARALQVAVMRMCDHPNVLSCYASFVHENELWLVMEFMSKGSCLHVMNVAKKEVTKMLEGFRDPTFFEVAIYFTRLPP